MSEKGNCSLQCNVHSVGYGGVSQSPLVTSTEKICLWNLSLMQTNKAVHTTYPSFSLSRQGCLLLYTRVASTFMSLEREVCVFVVSRGVFVSTAEMTESRGLADVSRNEMNWFNFFDTCAYGGGSFVFLCVKKLLYSLFKEGRKEGGVEADGAFY